MEAVIVPKVKSTGRYSYEAIPTDQKLTGSVLYEKKGCEFIKLGKITMSGFGVSHSFGFVDVCFGNGDSRWIKNHQGHQYYISKE